MIILVMVKFDIFKIRIQYISSSIACMNSLISTNWSLKGGIL